MNTTIAKSPREMKLEQLWKEFVEKSPKAEEFLHLARMMPYLQERAWDKYVETNPSEMTLRSMLNGYNAGDYIGMAALIGATLVKNYPTPDTLQLVMRHVPTLQLAAAGVLVTQHPSGHEVWNYVISQVNSSSLREQAARKLLTVTALLNHTLRNIMLNVPALKVVAGERLLKQSPTVDQLVDIVRTVPSLASRAWDLLEREREGTVDALISVVISVPNYRSKAARLLLAKEFKSETLFHPMFHIAKHIPGLREEAWKRLSTVTLSNTQLEAVAREAPELSVRALALRKAPERTTDIIMGEIFTVNSVGAV